MRKNNLPERHHFSKFVKKKISIKNKCATVHLSRTIFIQNFELNNILSIFQNQYSLEK